MKKWMMIGLLCTCSLQAQISTSLSGQIQNPSNDTLIVEFLEHVCTADWSKKVVLLDQAGRFETTIPVNDRALVYVEYVGYIVPLYLEADQSLHLSADRNQFDKSLRFQEKGNTSNNKVLQEMRREAGVFQRLHSKQVSHGIRINRDLANRLKTSSAAAKKELLINKNAEELSLFAGKVYENELSPEFEQFIETHLKFNSYTYRMWSEADKVLSDDFGFYHDHIYHTSYHIYLDEYILKYSSMQDGQKLDYYRHHGLLYDAIWANEYLPGSLKEEMLARLIYRNIRPNTSSFITKYYEDFMARAENPKLRSVVKERFQAVNEFGEGKPAPWFELEDNVGAWIALDAYKGQKIYLTFWASWCAPCLEEFHQGEMVRKELKHDLIQFVFINIDENKEKWLQHEITNSGQGLQVTASDDPVMRRSYKVNELPSHFLIDEEGNFVQEYPHATSLEFINFIRSDR